MSSLPSNLLLDSLSAEGRNQILAKAQIVPLKLRTRLQNQGKPPRYAFFLTSGIASVVIELPDGASAEVALIGHEGMVGAFSLLGPSLEPTNTFIQVAASGYQIKMEDLRPLFHQSAEIRSRILENVQQVSMTMSQIAACNRLHEVEARLARWLLMCYDRVQEDTIDITQEFLAEMLGARRTTVAVAAGALQKSGLIHYMRGSINIPSRELLESAACDCYPVIHRLFAELYCHPATP